MYRNSKTLKRDAEYEVVHERNDFNDKQERQKGKKLYLSDDGSQKSGGNKQK